MICPNCKSTNLEIIDYLIPTHGDVYWCKNCNLKCSAIAVKIFSEQLGEETKTRKEMEEIVKQAPDLFEALAKDDINLIKKNEPKEETK